MRHHKSAPGDLGLMFIRDYPGINAVKVGRLFLKPGDVYETITQSCRMVFHEASDRSLPLGRAGSATLVRHASVSYVVTTRHQLDIRRFSGSTA